MLLRKPIAKPGRVRATSKAAGTRISAPLGSRHRARLPATIASDYSQQATDRTAMHTSFQSLPSAGFTQDCELRRTHRALARVNLSLRR